MEQRAQKGAAEETRRPGPVDWLRPSGDERAGVVRCARRENKRSRKAAWRAPSGIVRERPAPAGRWLQRRL